MVERHPKGDRIGDIWGKRTPYAAGAAWPARVDQHLDGVAEENVDSWVRSACVLCSNGCGMDVAVRDGRMVGVRGLADDQVNRGRLGPKGLFGWQANSSPDRLTRPLVRRGDTLVESDWDTAMNLVVRRSRQIIAENGPLAMGFYTSGQLFLEDYYTLAVLARAGIGTPHLDGNTRLCTATAEWALMESFGCDGNPGSYTDIDECDTLLLVGHNVAETQTVLWMRMLDRLHGPDRPRLVVIDPRSTPAAREADVHLAVRPGTNLAILNAILHELVVNDWVDHEWVSAHTVGFAELAEVVRDYPPQRAAKLCGVEESSIREAARLVGTGNRLVSTVLQGVYQSHQATAAAVQVNNINLLRGMIGRPGCSVFQMNGQPTAQNTRETGADGTLPGFRNYANDDHVRDLARIWNVRDIDIPHWAEPTHAMEIFHLCEQGSIRFLWVSGTNPAVSLPELGRIRTVLGQSRLFLVVSDAFATETTQFADVVLPTAMWGEKTGTYTNADRTVHLSDKAIEPPGQARADLDIFLDYARRMNFRDQDGAPLLKWTTPEETFDAFREATRGRPCDYTGLSYDRLRHVAGIPWPCNERFPAGTPRLYTDWTFHTGSHVCESYGHDIQTGALNEADEYGAHDPGGRAVLKAAHFTPPHEPVTDDYPFQLSTGRTVYQWHTRTKTARVPRLNDAAPRLWIELNADDAAPLGIADGDVVRVESRRGAVQGPVRLTRMRPGTVFVPFHYGYWDTVGTSRTTAANEVTRTEWDPVSKQPLYKLSAVRVLRVTAGNGTAPGPVASTASQPTDTPSHADGRSGDRTGSTTRE